MNDYAKVKEHRELVRDMKSKAILNIDAQALQEHRKKKAMMKEVVDNSQKIKQIENDVAEIKQMIFSLAEKFKV